VTAPGRVTVTPETFTLVEFDSAEIAALVERLLDDIGLDRPVTIEVDETTFFGFSTVESIDPVVVHVESGALEDPRTVRRFSPSGSANVLGRVLFRVRDRLDPAFGTVPPDDQLTLAQSAAWDAYSVGRLARLGHHHFDERQRRLYQFRTRHGFTDVGDAVFAELWEGDGLTWADIEALSARAAAATAA
jgi:hypothetical protein